MPDDEAEHWPLVLGEDGTCNTSVEAGTRLPVELPLGNLDAMLARGWFDKDDTAVMDTDNAGEGV